MRRVIGIAELCRILGRSRSSISRYLADPSLGFPQPIRLGLRDRGWYSDEVEAWIDACPPAMVLFPPRVEGYRLTRSKDK